MIMPVAHRLLRSGVMDSVIACALLVLLMSGCVLPLQFADGESAATYGLTGEETYSIAGVASIEPRQDVMVKVTRDNGESFDIVARCRIDPYNELEYYRSGGILQFVLRNLAA